MLKVTMPARPEIDKKTGEPTGRMITPFTGRRAGLDFVDGVATLEGPDRATGQPKTLNPGQRFNFDRWGYTIEEAQDPDWQPATKPASKKKSATSKSKKTTKKAAGSGPEVDDGESEE